MLKKILISNILIFASVVSPRCEVLSAEPDKEAHKPITANIYFSKEVDRTSVSELGVTIDNIALNYPSVKNINLVIYSWGGDAYAGILGYFIVKNSSVPVHTINGAQTASAASLIFCGAGERSALPGTVFMLHPAATDLYGDYKPDAILRAEQLLGEIHRSAKNIYRQCTSMTDKQIDQMFKSEYFAKNINEDEASKIALTNRKLDAIPKAEINYFLVQDRT